MKNISKIRVIYADTDAMGIVYHTNYIKWFEIGRTELLREMSIIYAVFESKGLNLPLTKAYCHYFQPAKYDQVLLIETELDYVKKASMKFNCVIWDERKEKKLVEGYTVHACTYHEGKIVKIPENILEKINREKHK